MLDCCIDFAADLRAPPADSLPGAAEAVALLRAEALRLAAGDRMRARYTQGAICRQCGVPLCTRPDGIAAVHTAVLILVLTAMPTPPDIMDKL